MQCQTVQKFLLRLARTGFESYFHKSSVISIEVERKDTGWEYY